MVTLPPNSTIAIATASTSVLDFTPLRGTRLGAAPCGVRSCRGLHQVGLPGGAQGRDTHVLFVILLYVVVANMLTYSTLNWKLHRS